MKTENYAKIFMPKFKEGNIIKGRSWEYLQGDDGNYYSRRKGTEKWIKNTEKTGLNEVKKLFLPKEKEQEIVKAQNKVDNFISNKKNNTTDNAVVTGGVDLQKEKPKMHVVPIKEEKPWYDFLIPDWLRPKPSYGGGKSGGGGVGSRFEIPEEKPEIKEEVTQHQIILGNTETFNQAFARARKQGKKIFEFDGKKYTTDLDTTSGKDHWSAGQKRKQSTVVPVYVETKTEDKNGKKKKTTNIKLGMADDPDSIIPLQFKKGGLINYKKLFK